MLKAPFPWFGGKSRAAHLVWPRFGAVPNYVEPFAGSLAMLLGRQGTGTHETVNDLDGYISNFWRSVRAFPDEVARHAAHPVNECDLHARHLRLVALRAELTDRLMGDPEFCDPRLAGWWVWGICSWIGSGWCAGTGGWIVSEDGRMVRGSGGVSRQLPHLHHSGRGVHSLAASAGKALDPFAPTEELSEWMRNLALRLRRVRVVCGDWARVITPAVTTGNGTTGLFLDPPYSLDLRENCYVCDDAAIPQMVGAWCAENGDNPDLRIALCGYDGEHTQLTKLGWEQVAWSANGGMGNQGEGRGRENKHRERIWFSPHCLNSGLFGGDLNGP